MKKEEYNVNFIKICSSSLQVIIKPCSFLRLDLRRTLNRRFKL